MHHLISRLGVMTAAAMLLSPASSTAPTCASQHVYPTSALVEYVQECVYRHGGEEAYLYKCSCAIDHIAAKLSYDEFVEAGTFARYSTLGGKAGGLFRDTERGRQLAKTYRDTEAAAYQACGVPAESAGAR